MINTDLHKSELIEGFNRRLLNKLKNDYDLVLLEKKALQNEISELTLKLKDIHEYLSCQINEKDNIILNHEHSISLLNNQLSNQQITYNNNLKIHQDKIKELENEIIQIKNDFNSKIEAKLDYINKKDALESKIKEYEEKLYQTKISYENKINEIEREQIQEKQRLNRETEEIVEQVKEEMTLSATDYLELTTKKTIVENEQMSNELSYQSRQTHLLLNKNKILNEKNLEMNREIKLIQETQDELAKRNLMYQKTIQILLNKLKNIEEIQN